MHDHDRLDTVLAIGREPAGDHVWLNAAPPVSLSHFDPQPESPGHGPPQRREIAGVEGEHGISRR